MLLDTPDTLHPQDAFVSIQSPPIFAVSYTSLIDMEECLQAYFAGTLDDVPDLSRLYMPLADLIPGKPLMSQLDSTTLHQALEAMPIGRREAIYYRFQPDEQSSNALENLFVTQAALSDFDEFCHRLYCHALLDLSERIWTLL